MERNGQKKRVLHIGGICLIPFLLVGVFLRTASSTDRINPKARVTHPSPTEFPEGSQNQQPVQAVVPDEAAGNLRLFILAGQSNMTGYGEMSSRGVVTDRRVFLFGNDYRWKLAREPIDDPAGQVDLVSLDPGAGFSCGTSFARAFLERHPGAYIGLIPCAKSGSSIEEWQRSLSDSRLYGSCLKRALAASPLGKIRGLLFFQGETDAMNPALEPQRIKSPDRWREKFSTFVEDFRKDLGLRDLPVVFAQIGPNKNRKAFPNWEIVQKQQGAVNVSQCKMIRTDDLSLRDEIHFDSKSQKVIGERFAQAVMEILSNEEDR